MKKIKIKRLFHGFASVRDYQIAEAKKDHEDVAIYLGNEYIIIPHDRLQEGYVNPEVFQSIHEASKAYRLIDFDWRTYKPRSEEQVSLF